MKKKIIIISIAVIIIIIVGAFFFIPKNKKNKQNLQFTTIEKGDLKNTVSCTGTINPKGTVEVGTQVSGTISKVYVDYNDTVKKGQILAILDTTLLEISVMQAEAELAKAASQYQHDLKNYENNLVLHEKEMISDYDLESAKVAKDASYATKLTAETNLKKAKSNLSYAIIRSPINGTVINRDIEEGQTIAASYSTPTLFKIAQDLSNMQINALVDENDIGKIKLNQKAAFTVEAYSNEEFEGTVTQIRLEPTTVSNVVNYYVIINANNNKHLLLPGMTATIDIVIEEKNNILLVPNSALKFNPSKEMFDEIRKDQGTPNMERNPANSDNKDQKMNFRNDSNSMEYNKNISRLWIIDNANKIKFIPVETGMTDGQKTEILANSDVKEGITIITGINGTETINKKSNNNNVRMGPPMF